MNMVRKKRMTGTAARMILINLYMAFFQILLWADLLHGGRFALDRVSLRGQIARLPRRNLCSPLPLSGGSTHGLVPRDKAPWKSPQPTGHPPHGCQSGRFAGTADPRLGELAMCRP